MNIETLLDYIQLFKVEVVDSGFYRNIHDYKDSMGQYQNDIVNLRNVANDITNTLAKIDSGDLPDALDKLLTSSIPPFTKGEHLQNLNELINDPQIQQSDFYTKLSGILENLSQQLESNKEEVGRIETFLIPYSSKEEERITAENKVIVSVIFNDKRTISSLEQLSKTIHKWNRTLHIYHQILTSVSPEDIELIEVQNSSIDFIINLNVEVGINLFDLFKTGLEVYGGYLLYKKKIKPITDTYFGNKKLLKKQEEIEEGMLENINISIRGRIEEQHKTARKKDNKINTNINKGAEEVTSLLTSHIVRGNDMKLLAIPASVQEGDKERIEKDKTKLREISAEARNTLKELPEKERNLLLDKYGSYDNNDDDSETTKITKK